MRTPQTTHLIRTDETTVTKTFSSWQRGEHLREWAALRLLAERSPGLAPAPVSAGLHADPPWVRMIRLPGRDLAAEAIEPRSIPALASALAELHTCVPGRLLEKLPRRRAAAADLIPAVGTMLAQAEYDGDDNAVGRALAAARAWYGARGAHLGTGIPEGELVFGLGDGNLGNFLWDGDRVRLTDFEDSGVSDRCYEVADILEHPSAFVGPHLDPAAFVETLSLDRAAQQRLLEFRRLFACFWLVRLLPGGVADARNPTGTLAAHARRSADLWA